MPPLYQPFRSTPIQSFTYPDGERYYATPMGWYPSITTIIKATMPEDRRKALEAWKKREGEAKADRIRDTCGRNGNVLHDALEAWMRGGDVTSRMLGPTHWDRFKRIRDHLEAYETIHLMETAVFSHAYRLAGRLDAFGQKTRRQFQVIDFKTARREKKAEYIPHYFIQATFYAKAIQEMYPGIAPKSFVILVATDIDLQVFEYDIATYVPMLDDITAEYYRSHSVPSDLPEIHHGTT